MWHSTDSVLVGLGTPPVKFPSPADPPIAEGDLTFGDVMRADNLALADALAMARIMGVSREYAKKKLDVRRSTAYTLTDLRKGPIILIGAFNNPWAMWLTKDLRFHFERGENHLGLIVDRENRNNRSWAHDPNLLYSTVTQDYAVVSRFFQSAHRGDVRCGGGGPRRHGRRRRVRHRTALSRHAGARAPRNWEKKNLQVVLATEIGRGRPGRRASGDLLLVAIRNVANSVQSRDRKECRGSPPCDANGRELRSNELERRGRSFNRAVTGLSFTQHYSFKPLEVLAERPAQIAPSANSTVAFRNPSLSPAS